MWGRADADYWDVMISDLTADKNSEKSLLSMVLFLTYYEDVEGITVATVDVAQNAAEKTAEVAADSQQEVEDTTTVTQPLEKADAAEDASLPDSTPSLNSRLHAWVEANKNTRNIPPLFTKLIA